MRRRPGYTLVESLIVLAVVAVGLALLLPMLQQSQQDARRAICKNNLKQIGLALHNYHDTYLVFPPGWVSVGEGHGPRFGWQAMITPFLEQAPLFNEMNFRASPAPTEKLYQTVLKVYRCPVDSTPELNALRGGFGTSNYSGNYGYLPPPRLRELGLSDVWPGTAASPTKSTGIFARNSSVRLAGVTDGASQTILAGERCFTSGSAIWPGVSDGTHEDDAVTDCNHRSRLNVSRSAYSSRHEGGAFVLMGDATVRFIKDSIDSQPGEKLGVWQALAGKADNVPIGEF